MDKVLAGLKRNRHGHKDWMIALMIYRHGLRVSEARGSMPHCDGGGIRRLKTSRPEEGGRGRPTEAQRSSKATRRRQSGDPVAGFTFEAVGPRSFSASTSATMSWTCS